MKHILLILFLLLPVMTFGQSKEADSLYNKGIELYNSKQELLAVPIFQKADSLEKAQLDNQSPDYRRSEVALMWCYSNLYGYYKNQRDYANAIKYFALLVESRKRYGGENDEAYLADKANLEHLRLYMGQSTEADEYYFKGMALYDNKQAYEAIPYLEKSDSIEKSQSSKYFRSEFALIDCWKQLVTYYEENSNYTEAVRFQTLVVNSLKKIEGKKHGATIDAEEILFQYRLMLGQCPEADGYYEKGINLYKTHQAHLAVPYLEKSDSIEKSKSRKFHRSELALIKCWKDLAGYSSTVDDTTETIRLQTLVVKRYKKLLGKTHVEYLKEVDLLKYYRSKFSKKGMTADDYYNQGVAFLDAYRPNDAIDVLKKGDSLEKLTLKPDSPNYNRCAVKLADCWTGMANYYENDVKNYGEAVRYLTLVLEKRKDIFGEENKDYLETLKHLANIYYRFFANYAEAVRLQTRAVEICKKIYGEEHNKYVKSLSSLSFYKKLSYDYAGAIELMKKVVELSKKIYGEDSEEYVEYLTSLAYDYKDVGNHNEAIRLQTKVAEFKKNKYGEDHPLYADALSSLATFCAESGNYSEAIKIASKAIEIFKKDLRAHSWSYVIAYSDLADWNYQLGNYTEAIRLLNLAMEYTDRQEWAISSIMRMLADNYLAIGQYDKAKEVTEKAYSKSYSDETNYLAERFAFFTNKERTDFWNECSNLYCNDLPRVASIFPDSTLCSIAYNAQVFAKGFLLNSELEILRIFETKGNSALVERYHKLKQDREILDGLSNIPESEGTINADSLARAIDDEEHELVRCANELGNYTKNLLIDWKDIQRNLKAGDLAVEFANFKDTAAKQQIYAALVIKKDMKSPEIVKLFSDTAIEKISSAGYYKSPKLYNLIWKPLEKYLTNVKNVYFSPCGMFHTVGIEYLPDENRKIFAEKFNVYRLSSTRELALEHKPNPNKKAATYGGIKYDSDKDDGNVRGVATYLKGTKIESETVAKLLLSNKYEVIALSDTLATEESFKNLSGTGLKILHIGTHGFYYSESALENARFSFFSNNNQQSEEDKALSCSGLLFAGANFALDTENRSALPEGDDGILTAKEISRLDFQGLDLVVLSACQTGLGEVTGEGVFGLQRGFKKAGAQTIIMSLWEVDDYATRLLMTEFFKGLTAGKSKREAFLSALNYVKAKNSDPKYWAAFVMVDGKE